ncbi:MAG: hypothetical protein K1X87_01070 [Dehalococcoidia bacterium]|nr:hypothetical protein [Dehalococcoidia bacterium]
MPQAVRSRDDRLLEEAIIAARRQSHRSSFILAALGIGLVAAALPVFVTHGRPCAAPAPPRPGALTYLVLTSDRRVEELRCEAHGRLVFVRVHGSSEVSARLLDGSVAGVILDRAALARLRPGQLHQWLTTSSGRALVGFEVTASRLRSDAEGSVPPLHDDGWGPDLDDSFYGHLAFRSSPEAGVCGSSGTTPYRGPSPATALVRRLLAWASPAGGCGFG